MTQTTSQPLPSGYATGDEYYATRYCQGRRTVYSIDLSVTRITTTIKKPNPQDDHPNNRGINVTHANDCAQYLLASPTRVIPPLFLRAPTRELEFRATAPPIDQITFGLLTIPRLMREDVQILDGQHRILGMHVAMEKLSREIGEKRSARAQTHTHVDSQVRATVERDLDAQIVALEEKRRALGAECVTVQIVEIDDDDKMQQMFTDIAMNAKGISLALRSRFDRTRLPNRIMHGVADHPLLASRVEGEKDRLLSDNPNLVSAQHVADAVRAIVVGISGRISVRKADELDEREAERGMRMFLDALVEGFDDYRAIIAGTVEPPALRSRSLLGSPVMFRVLAGVFHDMAVGNDSHPGEELVPSVVQRFKDIQPWMQLPVSWSSGSPWTGSEALPNRATSALSRSQDLKEMVRRITAWR